MSDENPTTIEIMTGMEEKKFLFFKWKDVKFEVLPRQRGLELFEKHFLGSPYKMVVAHPDFLKFTPTFVAGYNYWPLTQMRGNAAAGKRSDKLEVDFYFACIAAITTENAEKNENAEVAYLPASVVNQNMAFDTPWAKSHAEMKTLLRIISRRTCYEMIKDELVRGIGANRNGLMIPFSGDGLFMLEKL